MSTVHGLHHVSILVSDTQRALDFYRDILGLAVDQARPVMAYPGAWLQVGAQQLHLLELAQHGSTGNAGIHGGRDRHFALQVGDLDVIRSALEDHGVAFTVSRSGRRALFCRDPDGNAIEFIESQ